MISNRGRKRYAPLVLASITVVLSAANPRAQTTALLPSVDLRRDVRLDADVWPGDFNGDGITDLVAGGRGASGPSLQVLIGRGDGTFGAPIHTAFGGRAIQVGDFNGDRRVDVIAAVNEPATGVVVLPGNGNGTFGTARQIDPDFAAFAVIGDFNGDTRRDVAVAGNGELRVYPGNGDLTFGTAMRLTIGTFGPPPECLAFTLTDAPPCGGGIAADVDNDGDLDIAVTGEQNTIHVFRNGGALLFAASEITVGFQPTDITARDLDGDGNVDLVVTVTSRQDGMYFNGFVDVLRGNGNGTFRAATRYNTGHGPFQVVVGDFTHDGQIDVATANRTHIFWPNCGPFRQGSDSVSILPGNRGVFGSPTTFALGDQSQPATDDNARFRNSVLSLNTSDFDRDRFPDLVVSWGALLLTRPPAANRPPVANAGPDFQGSTHATINLVGTATDPDNHLLDFVWTGPEGTSSGLLHPSSFCIESGLTPGAHTFTLTVDDGRGGRDDDSAVYTLRETENPPEVDFIRPAAGEVVPAGTPYTVRWNASDDFGIVRFDMYAFQPGGEFLPVSECSALPGTARQCTWQNPRPAGTMTLTILAYDTDGNTGGDSSGEFTIQGTSPPTSLPAGWASQEVGAVGAAGSATFSSNRFTIRGSGADIWGTADEFRYTYRALSENGEITAHVDSVQNVNRWVKAGVMIRESASPGSRHVSLFVTPTTEKGVAFQRRNTDGGVSTRPVPRSRRRSG